MQKIFILLLVLALPAAASCAKSPDLDDVMEGYLWQKRVVLIFAPDEANETYQAQRKALAATKGKNERDLVRWDIIANDYVRLDGEVQPQIGTTPFYKKFDVSKNDFKIILIGKDGEEKLRSGKALTKKQLNSLIDSMPMRKKEKKDQKAR